MNKRLTYPFRILITDILIILIVVLISIFVSKGMFTYHSIFSKGVSLSIYVPLAFTIFTLIGFLFFIEFKYNKLSLRNLFLLLGLLVAINNLIATLSLPYETNIEYSTTPYIVTNIDKIYSILYGFIIGFLPFIFTTLFPKKVNNLTYLKIVLCVLISAVFISVLCSLMIDFNAYISIIKSKFTDLSATPGSFFFSKNIFGWFLLCGMISSIYLHVLTKKWHWLIPLFIFFIFIIFTFSKSSIIVSFILLFFYLLINLIFYCKKNKDNLILTITISIFLLALLTILIIFIINSNCGILFNIKTFFKKAIDQGKATFNSRVLIWTTTLNLLKPFQYIFGFGMPLVGGAIRMAYGSHPDCPESATNIVNAHNSVIEIIAEGGFIYLIIYTIYLAILFYMAIKIYKKNKLFSLVSLINLFIFILLGFTGQNIFFGDTINIFFTVWIIVPLASMYFMNGGRKNVINSEMNKVLKNKSFKSNFLLNFNNKRLIVNDKNLLKDISKTSNQIE